MSPSLKNSAIFYLECTFHAYGQTESHEANGRFWQHCDSISNVPQVKSEAYQEMRQLLQHRLHHFRLIAYLQEPVNNCVIKLRNVPGYIYTQTLRNQDTAYMIR